MTTQRYCMYRKEELCKMTEKMGHRWRTEPEGGLCAVVP